MREGIRQACELPGSPTARLAVGQRQGAVACRWQPHVVCALHVGLPLGPCTATIEPPPSLATATARIAHLRLVQGHGGVAQDRVHAHGHPGIRAAHFGAVWHCLRAGRGFGDGPAPLLTSHALLRPLNATGATIGPERMADGAAEGPFHTQPACAQLAPALSAAAIPKALGQHDLTSPPACCSFHHSMINIDGRTWLQDQR